MLRSDVHRSTVPSTSGVYFFRSKGNKHLYIGKAKNIHKRLQQYFSPKSLRKQDMVAKAHHIERLPTHSEEEAIILETNLIREHTPMYNNLIKGDNAYVYLKIPKEDFPNIMLTRYKKNDKALYIGPKVRQRQLKQTLHIIRSVLKYRSSTKAEFEKGIVNSDYFFGLSEGRCVYNKLGTSSEKEILDINTNIGFVQKWTREEALARYKHIIDTIVAFFNGNNGPLEAIIRSDIDAAIEQQHFERAAKLRDVYTSITTIAQQVDISLDSLKSGIYVEIHSSGSWHFFVVMKLYKGKIIDVITGKESADEDTIQDILQSIEQEYTCRLHTEEKTDSSYSAQALATTGKKMNKLLKKERTFLQTRAREYLSSYLQSNHDQSVHITNELLKELETRYSFGSFPYLIECVDISHLSGDHTVGAITRMQAGKIDKSGYRRYRITSTDTGDDYLALEEVITRRFTKEPWPDLFVLDGGKGQLGIIERITKEGSIPKRNEILKHTTFIALGKGKARSRKGKRAGAQEYISMFLNNDELGGRIEQIPLVYDTIDRLLILLRDEAHRFANAYRKKRMQKDFSDIKKRRRK